MTKAKGSKASRPAIGAMAHAEFTPDMLAAMSAKIGLELRIDHSVYNEEATRLAILRFTEGVGDPNPLWTDEDYAKRATYGGLVAPPSFVIGCFSGIQFGWPGLGSFHSSSECAFYLPVRVGDVIRAKCVYQGFQGPRPSRFAGMMVEDTFENTYFNQQGALVARIIWRVINFERGRAVENLTSSAGVRSATWSEHELVDIEREVLEQQTRGAVPRAWETVEVGDDLETLTKGPLGMTDEIAFVAGGGAPIPRLAANKVALAQYRKHPQWAFRDETTMALEPVYSVHYNRAAANSMGVPLQYDVGFQRQCWQVQLLTNWAGDDGWVKRASSEYRGFVFLGDVVRLGGRVMNRYVDKDGDHVVDVTTFAMNQRGDDVMPGRATLRLPTGR